MRETFVKELQELSHNIIKMGSLVEQSIANTILALKEMDTKLAKDIIKNDDIIDNLEQNIEKECINMIARQHPLAKDLRDVSSALKIITDLERIGDHSADIAEIILRLANMKNIKPIMDITVMANKTITMLKETIDSYIKRDVELALKVCSDDDYVDELFNKIILELINMMKQDPQIVEQCIDYMFIVKYLERMGDHATNISEWVVYTVTGEHEHLQHSIED